MYQTIQSFLDDWRYEKLATIKTFRAFTDSSLSQKVYSEGRSLGFLAWHLVITLGEMGGKAGLNVDAPPENSQPPAKASEILAEYEKAGSSFESEVKSKWNDKMLSEEIDMYGEKWTRSSTLISLIKHQIHHRAQIIILMRQAGLKVPGIYGPSREEWSKMGMQAPD